MFSSSTATETPFAFSPLSLSRPFSPSLRPSLPPSFPSRAHLAIVIWITRIPAALSEEDRDHLSIVVVVGGGGGNGDNADNNNLGSGEQQFANIGRMPPRGSYLSLPTMRTSAKNVDVSLSTTYMYFVTFIRWASKSASIFAAKVGFNEFFQPDSVAERSASRPINKKKYARIPPSRHMK